MISELFSPGWGNIYRKDRKDGHGVVLVAVKRSLGLTLELEQPQYFVDGRGTLQAKKGR